MANGEGCAESCTVMGNDYVSEGRGRKRRRCTGGRKGSDREKREKEEEDQAKSMRVSDD